MNVKLKKSIILYLSLLIMVAFLMPVSTFADNTVTYAGLKYQITDINKKSVYCCGAVSTSVSNVIIPNQIKIDNGVYDVTGISANSFAKCKKLKTVTVNKSITTIGTRAFYNTPKLTKLTLKRNPSSITIGAKAFSKMGKKGGKGLSVKIPSLSKKQVKKLHKAGLSQKAKINKYRFTSIKVQFNANGGTASRKNKKMTNLSRYGKLPKATRSNYKFKGWYTKKKGGKKVTSETIVKLKKGKTLYAHWFGPKGSGGTITRAEYNRIKYGMSYNEVCYLIGGSGDRISAYTDEEYIDDSHEEWVDTSYWDYNYDDYGNEQKIWVEDGYYETVDDSYTEDHYHESYGFYGSPSGYVTFEFVDDSLSEIYTSGF